MFNNTREFEEWFAGSAVSRDGVPLIQFHSTPYPLYGESFWRFTHFGTANCAHHFLWNSIKHGLTGSLYPVALSIKNPLQMEDIVHHGASYLADALRDMRIFSTEETEHIQKFCDPIFADANGISSHYSKAKNNADALSAYRNCKRASIDFAHKAFAKYNCNTPYAYHAFLGYEAICQLLNEKGFDGVVYQNDREDDGASSWAITRTDQVASLFELRKLGIPHHLEYDPKHGNMPTPYWLSNLNI